MMTMKLEIFQTKAQAASTEKAVHNGNVLPLSLFLDRMFSYFLDLYFVEFDVNYKCHMAITQCSSHFHSKNTWILIWYGQPYIN